MKQRVEEPSHEELLRIEAQRSWVRDHFDPDTRTQYETVDGKLKLLDAILSQDWIRPDETVKLQCLGIAFGDILVQDLGLRWITVEDEYGRDPALRLDGSSVLVFPLTTISKRIERGEKVDIYALLELSRTTIGDVARRST